MNRKKKSDRPYKRFQYSEDDLKKALDAVRQGLISANKASKEYHIPKGTLINKLHETVPSVRKMGPPTVLTIDEEKRLEDWILGKAKVGYPMHAEEVKDAVQKILRDTKRENPFLHDRPGRKWMELFLERHPDIRAKNAEIISKGRASITEEKIRDWFSEIKEYLDTVNATDILDDPRRIFNSDETGVQLCPKSGKLLGPKAYKNLYEVAAGSEKECVTVLCTFSANGESVDPLIVYPYKRIPAAIAQTIPDGVAIGRSDSGWMVSSTFYEYISNVFYPWLIREGVKLPVLFFQDGHKSHINLETAEFCAAKQIHLVCLYPNATHILQLCDVAIFRPLKVEWKKVVRSHKQSSSKNITKGLFAPFFMKAYKAAIKENTIRNGFRICGLYPFNPDNVDYSKCMANRWKELSKKQEVLTDDAIVANETFLNKLESFIPADVLNNFREMHRAGTMPANDKILFGIWKNCQSSDSDIAHTVAGGTEEPAGAEISIENIATNVVIEIQPFQDAEVLSGPEQSLSAHPQPQGIIVNMETEGFVIDFPFNELTQLEKELENEMAQKDHGPNVVGINDPSNIPSEYTTNGIVPPENASNAVIPSEKITNVILSDDILNDNVPAEDALNDTVPPEDVSNDIVPPEDVSNVAVASEKTTNVVPPDDTLNNNVPPEKATSDIVPSEDFTTARLEVSLGCSGLSDSIIIKKPRSTEQIERDVWRKHLHFPKQDTKKQEKRETIKTPFAISSTEYRRQCSEKIRIQTEKDKEKERIKLERAEKRAQKQKLLDEKRKQKAEDALKRAEAALKKAEDARRKAEDSQAKKNQPVKVVRKRCKKHDSNDIENQSPNKKKKTGI